MFSDGETDRKYDSFPSILLVFILKVMKSNILSTNLSSRQNVDLLPFLVTTTVNYGSMSPCNDVASLCTESSSY